jgi:DNA repair protein RecO (recombination protein O)
MSRESQYTAIILKKQPFLEGDEIITFFTKEQGKVRALAKSVKQPKSKLQAKLQALFLVSLTLTTGKLPKIIGVEVQKVFSSLRENLEGLKRAFYAVELVLKFTPDEQANEQLFILLENFLQALDKNQTEASLEFLLAKFKIEVLKALGLDIRYPKSSVSQPAMFFGAALGGFSEQKTADAMQVSAQAYQAFVRLNNAGFETPGSVNVDITELQNILSQFIEYQLERKVNSEIFLKQV